MSIKIISKQFQASGSEPQLDSAMDKIVKYIPSDVVGAWLAASGAIQSANDLPQERLLWISFLVGVVVTILWKLKQTESKSQAFVSTGAFIVWVYALGGPFALAGWHQPLYGTLVLLGYGLFMALFNPK